MPNVEIYSVHDVDGAIALVNPPKRYIRHVVLPACPDEA
jgi:hypothetical protein